MSDDWDILTEDIEVEWGAEPAPAERGWTLSREQLRLFVEFKVSIPPTVPEMARILERLVNAELITWGKPQ